MVMRRGRHAADDGSLARSVGVHTARAALLIGVAVIIGLALLNSVDSGRGGGSTQVDAQTEPTDPPSTLPVVTTTTRPASLVKVLVANGTNTNGVAAAAKEVIGRQGYNALAAVDSTQAAKEARRNTIVYYAAGFEEEARRIAQLLGMTTAPPIAPLPTPLPVSDLKAANVLVLIGPDYASRGTTTGAGATTTTASGASAATTTTRRL